MKKKNKNIEINLIIARRTLESISSVLQEIFDDTSLNSSKYNLTSELLKSLDRQLRLTMKIEIESYETEQTLFKLLLSSGRLITAWTEFIYNRGEFLKELIVFSEELDIIEQQIGLVPQNLFTSNIFLN